MRVSGRRISILTHLAKRQLWQIAMLTAAGSLGAGSYAEAALYYWPDYDPSYYRPTPTMQPRRAKVRRPAAKAVAAEKETVAKPRGPLIISVSIQNQKVRIYDANGFFAESPISTGMAGHPTPMGVFSIIQKHKFHHSNIYSGAPMPYMQRITWSGVAMHAGVLPGYPASHGCIRMPMAFAVKMWNWTKIGARVIVTPGEITPANFSHPLLVTQKVVPQPVAAEEPKVDAPLGTKSDKGADAGPAAKPADANLDLRSTVGHAGVISRAQTRTADASDVTPAANASVTMSDAASGEAVKTDDSPRAEAKPDEAKADPAPVAGTEKTLEPVGSDDKPTETRSADAATGEAKSVEAEKTAEVQAGEGRKNDATKAEAPKAETAKAETPKLDAAKSAEKAAETDKSVDLPASPAEVKKDTARLPGVVKPELPKRTGQIAVFISRKDSKLYVRQEFKPLFEVPVAIVPGDRPLGTHVFTAEADKNDPNLLRWSVVSLPMTARTAARLEDEERPSRRRRTVAAPAEVKPLPVPDKPAEALDRITIPQDAMARIAEALTSGGSIIVSDQGINQGETGEGTDFIVSLR
jgi:lipoprotein-anchoring transpeptidase ErfK/SrfK